MLAVGGQGNAKTKLIFALFQVICRSSSRDKMTDLTMMCCMLLVGAQIGYAFGAMYATHTIRPTGFVVVDNSSDTMSGPGEMSQFMCAINAGKNGHPAFRVNNDTGKCESGNIITADAVQCLNGITVHTEPGNLVQTSCVISPTIAFYEKYNNGD